MKSGVGFWRCSTCGAAVYPQRLLCPRCHGERFDEDRLFKASVEEVSVIRHMIGQVNWKPKRIASVRSADGLRLTVGLLDDSPPGSVVELQEDNGAPFGSSKRSKRGE
jgi:uncharacterized protein